MKSSDYQGEATHRLDASPHWEALILHESATRKPTATWAHKVLIVPYEVLRILRSALSPLLSPLDLL